MKKNSFIHRLYCNILVFQRKTAKLLGSTFIYFSSKGIKSINPIIQNHNYYAINSGMISPEKLHLGVDFLKDNYTLCGTKIIDSPHYSFLKALRDDEDICNTDYYSRFLNGSLDSRIPKYISKKNRDDFKSIFLNRLDKLKKKQIKPVIIYKLNNTYYIADGKHRAALCCLYNKEVPYIEITFDYLVDSYRMWMYEKMLKKKKLYETNIKIYNMLQGDDNEK